MSKIVTNLILERRDKTGKVLEHREQESRSWVLHMIQMLYLMSGYNSNSLTNIHDITVTNRNLDTLKSANLQVASPPGDSITVPQGGLSGQGIFIPGHNVGIVVGSGVPTPAPNDDALLTPITHGRKSGQLLYSGTELYGLTFVNPNGSFTIQRYYTNHSGGNVTVNEVAIYCVGQNAYSFCIYHDAVSPGIAIADTQLLVAQIIPGITV